MPKEKLHQVIEPLTPFSEGEEVVVIVDKHPVKGKVLSIENGRYTVAINYKIEVSEKEIKKL